MALSTTATRAEWRTAWEATVKLEAALRFFAQGNAVSAIPYTVDVQVQALVDDLQAALLALEA